MLKRISKNMKKNTLFILFTGLLFRIVLGNFQQLLFEDKYPYGCAPPNTGCSATVGNTTTITCSSLVTDPNNCGACGNKCTAPESACASSACGCPSISGVAQTYCSGACINTQSNPGNCGGCGIVCPAGITCSSGGCACTGTLPGLCNGICVDKSIDPNNCGACGTVCPPGVNCVASVCGSPLGQIYCNGSYIPIDANNCGTCGNQCLGADSYCSISSITGIANCVVGSYNNEGCISIDDAGLGALGSSLANIATPYGTPMTSDGCYSFCSSAIPGYTTQTAPVGFYFTLSTDSTTTTVITNPTVTTQCYCYTGTLGTITNTGFVCSDGAGITSNSTTGTLQLYGKP